jgi:hypothetical protein
MKDHKLLTGRHAVVPNRHKDGIRNSKGHGCLPLPSTMGWGIRKAKKDRITLPVLEWMKGPPP